MSKSSGGFGFVATGVIGGACRFDDWDSVDDDVDSCGLNRYAAAVCDLRVTKRENGRRGIVVRRRCEM
jgi:hypothetical protein